MRPRKPLLGQTIPVGFVGEPHRPTEDCPLDADPELVIDQPSEVRQDHRDQLFGGVSLSEDLGPVERGVGEHALDRLDEAAVHPRADVPFDRLGSDVALLRERPQSGRNSTEASAVTESCSPASLMTVTTVLEVPKSNPQ